MQKISENFSTKDVDYSVWRLVDSHWQNVHREHRTGRDTSVSTCFIGTLADYLWSLGFDVPSEVDYCLAHNSQYSLKYRLFGGTISIFVSLVD